MGFGNERLAGTAPEPQNPSPAFPTLHLEIPRFPRFHKMTIA